MTNSLFQEKWWLDIVAPGRWKKAEIREGETCMAMMPYVIEQNNDGMVSCIMPPLTQTLGPWLNQRRENQAKRLEEEKRLMNQLLDALPLFHLFHQRFHHSITNWLPYYWRGFEQTTRYTYLLFNIADLDAIWKQMHNNTRTAIRKAEKTLFVREDKTIDALFTLLQKSCAKNDVAFPHPLSLIKKIDQEASKRQCGRAFFAEDKQKNLHSAVYIVWDSRCAYYLLGGSDPQFYGSNANALLLWHAIQYVSKKTAHFDFEGSMIEGIERFFHRFGAKQVPYFSIEYKHPSIKTIEALNRGIKGMWHSRETCKIMGKKAVSKLKKMFS